MIASGLFWLSLRSFLVGSTGAEKRAGGDETLGKGRRTDRSAKPSGPASSRHRGTLSSVVSISLSLHITYMKIVVIGRTLCSGSGVKSIATDRVRYRPSNQSFIDQSIDGNAKHHILPLPIRNFLGLPTFSQNSILLQTAVER